MMHTLATSSTLRQTNSQMAIQDTMTQQQSQHTSMMEVTFQSFLRQLHWNQRMRTMVLEC